MAEYAIENNIPILFRNHEARPAAPDRKDLRRQIEDALSTPVLDLDLLRKRTHMLFNAAVYSPTLHGHYGLNVAAYTHFTSPIRRYADLVNHQQLRVHISKEHLEAVAEHLNSLARREKEEAKEHFKERANERAIRQANAWLLDGLSAKDFERVVKVELRSGEDPSEALEAWERRLNEGTVPVVCQTLVLTHEAPGAAWRNLQAMCLKTLSGKDAVSILTQATMIAGWPEVRWESSQEGPSHAPSFKTEASITLRGKIFKTTVLVHAGAAKHAKQRAAVEILRNIVNEKGSSFIEVNTKAEAKADHYL